MPLNSFTVATIKRQIKGISDAIVKDSVLLKYLKEKGRISYNNGGDGFEFRLRSSESAIGGSTTDLGENAARTISPFEKVTGAYRQYRWDLWESLLQEQRNKNAPSEAKMFDQIMEDLNEVKQSANKRLVTHMYADGATLSSGDATGSTPMLGLEAIIDDDNTYFGVARSSNSFIQAQVNTQAAATFDQDTDNNGVAEGIEALQTLQIDCSQGRQSGAGIGPNLSEGKDMPDCVICDGTRFQLFANCLQAQRLYTDKGQDPEQVLSCLGMPIKWDPLCTASRFYMLNSKHLNLDIIPGQLLVTLDPILTQNPLGRIHVIVTQGQFYSRNPRYLGSLQLT